MKTRLSIGMIIIVLVIVFGATGTVLAAHPVPGGNESSSITVITSAAVKGNIMARSELALEQTAGTTNGTNPSLGPSGEVAVVGYSENTMGVSGTAVYQKATTIETGNQNIAGHNLYTDRLVEFDAEDGTGGRMTSDENTLVFTASASTESTPGCAFGGGTNVSVPATCEIVEAGSKLDVSEVSAHTTSDARAISDTPGTPVALDYSIAAQGLNQTPGDLSTAAVGSAEAYVNANMQSGIGNSTAIGGTTEYHDVTSVDGLFDLAKEVSYSSAPHS
jgi:hypothetical protein